MKFAAKAVTTMNFEHAMEADVNRILSPFGGEIDCTGAVIIAELWTPPASAPMSKVVDLAEWREAQSIPF